MCLSKAVMCLSKVVMCLSKSCDASVPSLSCSCPSAGLHPAGCSEVPGKTDAALVRLEMDMEVQCAVCRDSTR